MSDWILVPCLVQLRKEFNEIAPGRDRESDGSIADNLHGSTSDHCADEDSPELRYKDADKTNEVHAIDVDRDLRTPGLDMEKVVQFLLGRCRSGAERRLRYIIWNRRIWEASNGWRQRAYYGKNLHDHHAHFSGTYISALEASTASWHLEDIPVALTEADKKWISDLIGGTNSRVETLEIKVEAVDDKVEALTKQRALNSPTTGKPDRTYTSPVGEKVFTQGIVDPWDNGERSPAHEVLTKIAQGVKDLTTPNPS